MVLSVASSKPVTMPVNLSGNASLVSDYTVRLGDLPVRFAPGVVLQTIRIRVRGDNANEADETITMTIPSNGLTNATQGMPNVRHHLIRNDD